MGYKKAFKSFCKAQGLRRKDFEISEHGAIYGYGVSFGDGGDEYAVLTEAEADTAWDDALDSYLDDCVEGAQGPYFDRDAWKRDARMDGRGHALSSYDGEEHECPDGYLVYRTN